MFTPEVWLVKAEKILLILASEDFKGVWNKLFGRMFTPEVWLVKAEKILLGFASEDFKGVFQLNTPMALRPASGIIVNVYKFNYFFRFQIYIIVSVNCFIYFFYIVIISLTFFLRRPGPWTYSTIIIDEYENNIYPWVPVKKPAPNFNPGISLAQKKKTELESSTFYSTRSN